MKKIGIERIHIKLALCIISIISICLIEATDTITFRLLNSVHPSFGIIAEYRLSSLVICYLLYKFSQHVVVTDNSEVPNWKKTLFVSIFTLIATFFVVLVTQVWIPIAQNWRDLIPFLFTGLLAEELLFRGCIYNLIKKITQGKPKTTFSYAVIFSSLLFSLHHLAYHEFHLTQESLSQVVYTFFAGIIFATVRESSGKLWPAIILHMLVNMITLIRSF